jgi:N-acyl-D-aspartate/D-glutamate deacylase
MSRILLRNGLIMDGTGTAGYQGDVLIEDAKIKCCSARELDVDDCEPIDCAGAAIAPVLLTRIPIRTR